VFQQLRDERDTFDLDTQQQLILGGRHDMVFGAAVRVSRGNDTGNAAFRFDPEVAVTTMAGVFVQDEITIVPRRFAAIVGAKFERNTFTGVEPQPSVRVRWTPSSQRTVWGAVSHAVRLPTRFDTDLRFTNPATGAVVLRGGRDFESEKVVAYEAGYRMQWADRLSFDVSAYTNVYGDLRSQEFPTAPGQPVFLRNLLNARTSGAEFAGTVGLLGTWRLHAAYTYLHERFTFDPESRDPTGGFAEFNDPTHLVQARSSVDLPHGIEVDGVFRYVDRLPHPVVPAYSELDARIGWRPKPTWDVSLIGQNLLHAHHQEFRLASPTIEEFERGVYLRFTWRF
jgi:iron complex outermembrane receptor protein